MSNHGKVTVFVDISAFTSYFAFGHLYEQSGHIVQKCIDSSLVEEHFKTKMLFHILKVKER